MREHLTDALDLTHREWRDCALIAPDHAGDSLAGSQRHQDHSPEQFLRRGVILFEPIGKYRRLEREPKQHPVVPVGALFHLTSGRASRGKLR